MSLLLRLLCTLGLALGPALGSPTPDDAAPLHQGSCPESWHAFDGRCYKYVNVRMTWADAELHCVSQGANLASVHGPDEFRFVQSMVMVFSDPGQYRSWIGLTDVQKEGEWMWSDGTKVVFTQWRKGEPNDAGGNEDCAATSIVPWNDYPCFAKFPFICKSRGD